MTMTETQKQDFINAYTRALVTSWSSDEYNESLHNDPRTALAEVGLTVPEDARIELITTIPEEAKTDGGNGHLDRQLAEWEAGETTGVYRIHIPDTPQMDVADIEQGDLAGVSGAGGGDVGIDCSNSVCCCCCPCSCCT